VGVRAIPDPGPVSGIVSDLQRVGSTTGGVAHLGVADDWNVERKSHESGYSLLGKREQSVFGRTPAVFWSIKLGGSRSDKDAPHWPWGGTHYSPVGGRR
jgi:hypothetical protein